MATWRVELSGQQFDLQELAALTATSDPRVVQEDGVYLLEASAFDSLGAAEDVYFEAVNLVPVMRGAARLANLQTREITIRRVSGRDEGGEPFHLNTLSVAASAVIRIDWTEDDRQLIASAVSQAHRFPHVRRVLELLQLDFNWFIARKAYEIALDDLGGQRGQLARVCGIADAELARFYEWTSREVHGGSKEAPRSAKLEWEEAQQFFRSIIKGWLQYKATQ